MPASIVQVPPSAARSWSSIGCFPALICSAPNPMKPPSFAASTAACRRRARRHRRPGAGPSRRCRLASTCLAGRLTRWFDVVSLAWPARQTRAGDRCLGDSGDRPHPRRRRRLHRHDRGPDVGLSWAFGRHRGGSTGQAAVTWPGRGRAALPRRPRPAGRPPRRPGGRLRPVGAPRPAGMTMAGSRAILAARAGEGPSVAGPSPHSASACRGRRCHHRVTVMVSTSVVVPRTSGVVRSVLTVPTPAITPLTLKL
jgi:hypothetical protein